MTCGGRRKWCGGMCGGVEGPIEASQLCTLDGVGFLATKGIDAMGSPKVYKGGSKTVWEGGKTGRWGA